MASLSKHSDGTRRLQFFDQAKRRRSIRLPAGLNDDEAIDIKRKVEALIEHKHRGKALHYKIARWIDQLEASLYDKLAAAGLLEPRLSGHVKLEQALNFYIDRRSSDVKQSTLQTYRNVRRNLVDYFGPDRLLDSITQAEADDWRRWLRRAKDKDSPADGGQGLSSETTKMRCRGAKYFFRDAERRKLIQESPFTDMKGISSSGNREKDYFVTREDAAKVLKGCPDAQWKLVFALARFGGLRCPSEVVLMKWGDVNWQLGRIVVHCEKTKHHDGKATRVIPLFPELRPYLQAVWDELPEDFDATKKISEQPVITRWRMSEVNLRTRLHKIIEAVGLTPWPKAFVALRSTRATELREEGHPPHVVNAWIGHSQRIAERHYLQVTDEHYDRAVRPECTVPVHIGDARGDKKSVPDRTTSQSSKNLRLSTIGNGRDGRDRTRICDLLHVKQAL